MDKNRIMYKVVKNHDGILYSFNGDDNKERLIDGRSLVYTPKQEVFPKIKLSKLYVFSSLHNANQFIERNFYHTDDERDRIEFWKCFAYNISKCKGLSSHPLEYWKLVEKIGYENIEVNESLMNRYGDSSFWCDSLILLEKVK